MSDGTILHLEAAFLAFIVAPGFACGCRPAFPVIFPRRLTAYWAVAELGGMGPALILRHWVDVLVFAAGLAVALLWDWWQRKGKRAARQLGAKSKAVISRMVQRAREAAPVPVPQGARA